MKIDILTLFPEMFAPVLGTSIIGNAQKNGIVDIKTIQIRDFADNKHNRVDDYPYGGGNGMVMQAEPISKAIERSKAELVCYLTPKGRPFNQNIAKMLSKQKHIAFLCGHYEGIDQRAIDEVVDLEISIGDFVLTGGEIPAMAVVDSVVRMLPGVLNVEQTEAEESFYNGILEYPQYTRPEEWVVGDAALGVPKVLLSGNHAEIEKWRKEKALEVTKAKRPDLLETKRIGILGGSFNPVHAGHIDIAQQAMEHCNLDKVLFIPANVQPHKQNEKVIENHQRLAMLQIAINDYLNFEVSTMEIDRGGVSYTIETLRELKKMHSQDEFFFIIGEDCQPEKWNDYEEMKKLIEFVKLPRRIDISSTEIRNGKMENLPTKVAKYMEKNRITFGDEQL